MPWDVDNVHGQKEGALIRITAKQHKMIIDLGYCNDLGRMNCISGQPCRVYVHHVVGRVLVCLLKGILQRQHSYTRNVLREHVSFSMLARHLNLRKTELNQ